LNKAVKQQNEQNLSLADFVAPKDSGRVDTMGGFVVTAGAGVETFANEFFTAIDEASKFCPVLFGAVRYLVKLWFIGLAKVCCVAIWQRAFFSHPCNCR
jgi:hypothetical protein